MALAALPRFRTQAFIDGAFRDAASGATFATENPATGEVIAHVAAGDAADIDAAVASARRAFEDGRWSRRAPGRSQDGPAPVRGPARGEPRGARDARRARGGQADHRLPRGRPARHGQDVPLVRRGDRQGLRRRRADRARRARADRARADRRGGRGRALELPDPDGGVEGRAGARGRQQRDRQAVEADLAVRDPDGRARRRGGRARRRVQRGARVRSHGRPGARPAHGRRHGHVHRLDRGRAHVPDLRRREQPQGDHARVRRQVAAARARGAAGPRHRHRAGAVRRAR